MIMAYLSSALPKTGRSCKIALQTAHLKCLWNEIFYYHIRNNFQNDKEWRLFYCDSTLGCRVIQDFALCKLDDLWRHSVDTNWCKITKNWISLTTFSVKNWNLVQLSHSSQSYIICPLWHFQGNTMSSRPYLFKGENQSFPPPRSVICYCCSFSGCEQTWTLHNTSTRKSVTLWSNK